MNPDSQPSTSRGRFSADQARNLIQRWIGDDSDSSEETSDCDLNLSSDEEEQPTLDLDRGADESSDGEVEPAPKRQCKGKGKGKSSTRPRSRSTQSSATATAKSRSTVSDPPATASARDNGGWSHIEHGGTANTIRFLPTKVPGVLPESGLDENSSALDCLSVLLDREVKQVIVTFINDYAEKRIAEKSGNFSPRSVFARWKKITVKEFDKFMAVLILIGLDRRPAISDYWSMSPEFCTAWYHSMFPRQRFQDIYHSMLHAGDKDAEGKDKIEPFMNLLLGKFRGAFYPFQELSIDEMVIGFKGRWQFKQFNASKPSKYHIKTFGLCDSSTGYVMNILTYFGANTSYDPEADADSGAAVKIFDTLLTCVDRGHKIYADRYYTTRALVDHLLKKRHHYTGTLMLNRKSFPPQLKNLSLQHRQMRWFLHENADVLCVAFRDKKAKNPVVLVSTDAQVDTTRVKDVDKPTVIHDYNSHMNGCDLLDQKVTYYPVFSRKSVKWWKKLFFWMMEITQVNAFILYTLTRTDAQKKIGLKKFKLMLVRQIVESLANSNNDNNNDNNDEARAPGRQPENNPMERIQGTRHIISYVKRDRNCVVCSKDGARKRTHFVCLGCSGAPHLHPKDCFQAYHNV
ncbi:piggyBac transposable element-derived protein 4 [Aplysia californica]|uniref:PiggyBac transposable element-derived protein 4 n=1 Tax=Aplysia californica TaxID=6500 RepID=A0ABM0JDR9_APLCA|nr:piggyBac transposable element-derived protein 4 [Aplysia californica]